MNMENAEHQGPEDWRGAVGRWLLLAMIVICVVMLGCGRLTHSDEGVIATDVVVPVSGAGFAIDPPQARARPRFEVRVRLATDWEFDPSSATVRIGGDEVRIVAELRTVEGDAYRSQGLRRAVGAGGDELIFIFPEDLPRNIGFDRVVVSPSVQIICEEISWVDWRPK